MTVVQDDLRTIDVAGVHATLVGSGGPVTLLAHGIGGSVAETRPLASRLRGTRVLLEFRGHGRSDALPDGWDYDLLAEDIREVADSTGATGAVGLSLGSGGLLRVLSYEPERFDRLAFVLPAAIDAGRADGATLRLESLGSAIDSRDVDAVAGLLVEEVPVDLRERRGTAVLLRRRARQLVERPSPRPRHPRTAQDRPVPDRRVLARITAPTLVVGQAGDPLHRLDVAAELAAALPHAQLLPLPAGGVFWTAARTVQSALAAHLTPEDT